MPGVHKIPTQDKYKNVMEGEMDLNKNCEIRWVKWTCLQRSNPFHQYQLLCWEDSIWISGECKKWRFSGGELQGSMGQAGEYALPHPC